LPCASTSRDQIRVVDDLISISADTWEPILTALVEDALDAGLGALGAITSPGRGHRLCNGFAESVAHCRLSRACQAATLITW
jgi:hypothetical protein